MSKKVLVVFLACLVPVLGLGAQPKQAEEPLYGTWVNEQFGTGKGSSQKIVISADGRELDYLLMELLVPAQLDRLVLRIHERGNLQGLLSGQDRCLRPHPGGCGRGVPHS